MTAGWHDEAVRQVFRPAFGRALFVVVAVICAVVVVALLIDEPAGALRAAPWLALVTGTCWALFWRPEVAVDDGGVQLVNPLRTVDLPWPAIHAVDTKWALTLDTAYGRFTGWAAPAPGIKEAVRATKQDASQLPDGAASQAGIRPGDLPSSQSGSAAINIRERWEQLRDAGHLDDPRLERDRAPIRWHVGTIAAGVVLVVLALAGLLA